MAEINVIKSRNPLYQFNFFLKRSALGKEQQELVSILQRFTAEVIHERMRTSDGVKLDEGKNKKTAFLDVMLNAENDDGQKLSAGAVQEEVDTFMTAGHDTNSAAMAWTIYLLGRYPDVLARVQSEIDEVFANDSEHSVTMADVRKFQYLEMVIKESLRLFPPAVILGRYLTEDCAIDGHLLPRGSTCYINVYTMHRHPHVWSDPDRFDPERFTKDNSVGRHPYAFIPFSAGPRNCIGQRFAMQEQKVLLSYFLREFDVKSNVPERDMRIITGIVARPGNVHVEISKRVRW